ncbi:MAG: hypothetical protein LBJ24_00805 [Treponema sp.]|jgi:hypothetical protein|nr:hypothetical protein [Treponema sp.]
MKLFGCNIRYSPEETASARMSLMVIGCTPREATKTRAYKVTTGDDLFEKYRIAHGFLEVIKMHLVLGLGYLFRRLKKEAGK